MTQIPHVLHFVWLGGEVPAWAQDNIATFIRHNPTWQMRLHTDRSMLMPWYARVWGMCKPNSSQQCDLLRFSILQREPGWYFDCDCRAFMPMSNIEAALVDDDRIVIPNYGDYPGTTMTSTWMMGATEHSDWRQINDYVAGWRGSVDYLSFSNTMTGKLYASFQTVSYRIANSGTDVLLDDHRPTGVVIGHGFKPSLVSAM